MSNQGTKHDNGKPRLDLIPYPALVGVARVLSFGANKYGEWNWYKGLNYTRCVAAALRHIYQFLNNHSLDNETKLYHVDHAIAELMFLSTFLHERREELDDRKPRAPTEQFDRWGYGGHRGAHDLLLRGPDTISWDGYSSDWRAGVALHSDQK